MDWFDDSPMALYVSYEGALACEIPGFEDLSEPIGIFNSAIFSFDQIVDISEKSSIQPYLFYLGFKAKEILYSSLRTGFHPHFSLPICLLDPVWMGPVPI